MAQIPNTTRINGDEYTLYTMPISAVIDHALQMARCNQPLFFHSHFDLRIGMAPFPAVRRGEPITMSMLKMLSEKDICFITVASPLPPYLAPATLLNFEALHRIALANDSLAMGRRALNKKKGNSGPFGPFGPRKGN